MPRGYSTRISQNARSTGLRQRLRTPMRHSPGGGIVPEGVRMKRLTDTGALGGFVARVSDDLTGDRIIGGVPPAAGEQPVVLPGQSAIVLAEFFEQVRAEHDVAVLTALAAANVN